MRVGETPKQASSRRSWYSGPKMPQIGCSTSATPSWLTSMRGWCSSRQRTTNSTKRWFLQSTHCWAELGPKLTVLRQRHSECCWWMTCQIVEFSIQKPSKSRILNEKTSWTNMKKINLEESGLQSSKNMRCAALGPPNLTSRKRWADNLSKRSSNMYRAIIERTSTTKAPKTVRNRLESRKRAQVCSEYPFR